MRQLIAFAVNVAGREQTTYLSCPNGGLTLPLACPNHPLGNTTSKWNIVCEIVLWCSRGWGVVLLWTSCASLAWVWLPDFSVPLARLALFDFGVYLFIRLTLQPLNRFFALDAHPKLDPVWRVFFLWLDVQAFCKFFLCHTNLKIMVVSAAVPAAIAAISVIVVESS